MPPDFLPSLQIPEHFGAVRAIAEGLGSELLVGTTKNALLRGDLAQGFSPVIQVGGAEGSGGAGGKSCWEGRGDGACFAAGPHGRALGAVHTPLPEPLPHLRPRPAALPVGWGGPRAGLEHRPQGRAGVPSVTPPLTSVARTPSSVPPFLLLPGGSRFVLVWLLNVPSSMLMPPGQPPPTSHSPPPPLTVPLRPSSQLCGLVF